MYLKKTLYSLFFVSSVISPITAENIHAVAKKVGITGEYDRIQPYSAMNVIRNFQKGFLEGDFKRDHLGNLGTYVALGKICYGDKCVPNIQENRVSATPATQLELNDIFKTFLVAEMMTTTTKPRTDFRHTDVHTINHDANHKNPLSHRFMSYSCWDDAKSVEKHIVGAAFLSRVAELMARTGYGDAYTFNDNDLQQIVGLARDSIGKYLNVMNGNTSNNIDNYINAKVHTSWKQRGFNPLAILEEAKALVRSKKPSLQPSQSAASLNPKIKKVNDDYYVMPTKDPTLIYAMEKITPDNIDTWKAMYNAQTGDQRHYYLDTGMDIQSYKHRRGFKTLNSRAGSGAVTRTYALFDKRTKAHKPCDFWIAYAFSTKAHEKPTYPFNIKDAKHIENLVTVLTSDNVPFITFAGISQNDAHVLSDIPEHVGNIKPLFAFVANVMRSRSEKQYMINCPTPVIGNMLKKAWPDRVWMSHSWRQHTLSEIEIAEFKRTRPKDDIFTTKHLFGNDANNPLEIFDTQNNGLKLRLAPGRYFNMTARELNDSWYAQHQDMLPVGGNPLYTMDLAFLASLV